MEDKSTNVVTGNSDAHIKILFGSITRYCLKLMGYDIDVDPKTEERAKSHLDALAKKHGWSKKEGA